MFVMDVLRIASVIGVALLIGKAVAKLHLPAVLGCLLAGMVFGPYGVGLLDQRILDTVWYSTTLDFVECGMGLMIGMELVWRQMRSLGRQIFIITLTQSLGTFFIVSAAFSAVFYLLGIPAFLGMIFGGIALATAPAPALSIVNEYKTSGPVTKTLIPMAALDDVVAIVVFLSVMAMTLQKTAGGSIPVYLIGLVILIPVMIGGGVGFLTGIALKRVKAKRSKMILVLVGVLFAAGMTVLVNHFLMPIPMLNFMLTGMVYSAVYANMVEEDTLHQISTGVMPIIQFCFVIMIVNLGAPLDYHLILGAGFYTALYIITRAFGKIGGAAFGGWVTNAPKTVRKYLGFTLLPHSGVSLVLTGIAVSALSGWNNEYADIVRGTIAAAAVINEVIAVLLAKKAFEKAGEVGQANLQNIVS